MIGSKFDGGETSESFEASSGIDIWNKNFLAGDAFTLFNKYFDAMGLTINGRRSSRSLSWCLVKSLLQKFASRLHINAYH